MAKLIMIALALGGCCLTSSTPSSARAGDFTAVCGEMPTEPPWSLTIIPGGPSGETCMKDADYIARDKYHQQLRDWAVCATIEACKARGECG